MIFYPCLFPFQVDLQDILEAYEESFNEKLGVEIQKTNYDDEQYADLLMKIINEK